MLLRVLYLASVCHAWSSYGGLQDPKNCNPLVKDSQCHPDAAFAGKKSFELANDTDIATSWLVDAQTSQHSGHADADKQAAGLQLTLADAGQAPPTMVSRGYLLFGKVSVKAKAARGAGLVTTIALKSDSGDEIDWEMLGAYQNQAQSNYYHNGQPLFNTYNTTYAISSSSYDDVHTYAVEWTDQLLRFSIDGSERKIWHRQPPTAPEKQNRQDQPSPDSIPAAKWPQTPMQIHLGLWATVPSDDPGKIAWAGGVPSWTSSSSDQDGGHQSTSSTFTATFVSVDVEDYAGFCEEFDDGVKDVEYRYDDKMKGWEDVDVKGCKKRRDAQTTGTLTAAEGGTTTAAATATATGYAETPTQGGRNDNDTDTDIDDENGATAMTVRGSVAVMVAMFVVGYMIL